MFIWRIRPLRLTLTAGLHLLWWSAAVTSIIVALFSHGLAVGVYEVPCSGDGCRSMFQLTDEQFGHLRTIGFSPEVYGGLMVVLLTVQNLSALAIGLLVYRYGWRDAYSVVASLLILVTGTIFSTDDTLLGPALRSGYEILNEFGSMYLFFFFLFPDGKFVPRWTIVPAVIWLIPMASSFWLAPGSFLDLMTWPFAVKNVYMMGMHGLVIAAQVYRYFKHATAQQKRQIRWFVTGMSMYWLGGAFGLIEPFPSNGVLRAITLIILFGGLIFLPFAIGMAVLENRLRQMAIAFNRTIVYLVLSVMIVLVFAMVVGLFGLVLQGQVNTIVALLATGLIAMLGQPIRERVQRAVNHLVYGEREDPYSVLSGLVEKLEGALTHRTLLASITQNVAAAFRLPYAAIEVQRNERIEKLAEYGEPQHTCSRIPLAVQGEEVGWLVLGVARTDDMLPRGKERLLDDLIRQVSIAVQAVHLTEELHRSRERLVGAREEERRRLRRDLHDVQPCGHHAAAGSSRIAAAVGAGESRTAAGRRSKTTARGDLRHSPPGVCA
jgi:hypothetical protein